MGQVCCCEVKVKEVRCFSFQRRVLLLKKMEELLSRGNYAEAKYLVSQLCKDLQVTRETKMVSNLGLVDILQQKNYLVDRQAHDFLRRLQEAFAYENTRHALYMCRQLCCHFNFTVSLDTQNELRRLNTRTLACRNRQEIRMIGCDFTCDKNFKNLKTMISRNPNLRKLSLNYCGLTTTRAQEVLHLLADNKYLYYMSLRGNDLSNRVVYILEALFKDPNSFPVLCWVELRNNNRIIWLPRSFMEYLQVRWEKKFEDGQFCRHSTEETNMMAAMEAVVQMNNVIKRHTLEQKNDNEQQ